MLLKDTWLSQYFNEDVYKQDAKENLDQYPLGLVYTKLPVEQTSSLNSFIKKGFELIEVSVQFKQIKEVDAVGDSYEVSCVKPEEAGSVIEIASTAFKSSRFYQDARISREIADKIKGDWVSNFFKGERGDTLFVARLEGKIAGFLLLIGNTIDLIAVAEPFKRAGVAKNLVAHANKEIGLLKAGTQLINKASIAFYEKNNFVLEDAFYVLHKHISE